MTGAHYDQVALQARIIRLLTAKPRQQSALAQALGIPDSTMRNHLKAMHDADMVHPVNLPRVRGRTYQWSVGPDLLRGVSLDDLARRTPSVVIVPFRDPLVAALFGPAKAVATV